jgi:hypothetical protein
MQRLVEARAALDALSSDGTKGALTQFRILEGDMQALKCFPTPFAI